MFPLKIFRPVQHSMPQVIQIPESEKWFCFLSSYGKGHNTLIICLYINEIAKIHIAFQGTDYLQCSSSWQGANISTASERECQDMLMEHHLPTPEQGILNYLSNQFCLYKIGTANKTSCVILSQSIELILLD